MPISRCISVSERADMMAPDLTLARQAATYHGGIPTHSSNHATTVGPFHRAKGVPAFIASANSSCLKKKERKRIIVEYIHSFINTIFRILLVIALENLLSGT